MNRKQPSVVRGATKNWLAYQWTIESLAERVADVSVAVHTGRWLRAGWRVRREGVTRTETAGTYLNSMANGNVDGYLAGDELFKGAPFLRSELSFRNTGRLSVNVAWIGPAGTETPLHYDWVPNLYAQFQGRKRWQFWRPGASLESRWGGVGFTMSNVDVHDGVEGVLPPDLELEVGPGDLLCLPPRWWHRVETLEDSIAVNRWWAMESIGKLIGASL